MIDNATQDPEEREEQLNQQLQRLRPQTPEERAFSLVQRQAKMFAESDLVPKEYQGKIGNCVVALELGHRLDLSTLQVMQNLFVIHGRPSWKGEFLIARINQSGVIKGRLKFKFEGSNEDKSRKCTAWGIDPEDGERLEVEIDWDIVKKYAWHERTGSHWNKIPDQMFTYRSAAFFARRYCPEVVLGIPVEGEVEDIELTEVKPGKFEVAQDEEVKTNLSDTSQTVKPEGSAPLASSESPSGEDHPPDAAPSTPSPRGEDIPEVGPRFGGGKEKKPEWFYMEPDAFLEFWEGIEDTEAYYQSLDKGLKRAWTNRYNNYVLPNIGKQADDVGRELNTPPGAAVPKNTPQGGSNGVQITNDQDDELDALTRKNKNFTPEIEAGMNVYMRENFGVTDGDWGGLSQAEAAQLTAWLKEKTGGAG